MLILKTKDVSVIPAEGPPKTGSYRSWYGSYYGNRHQRRQKQSVQPGASGSGGNANFLTSRGERMVELVPVEQQKQAVPDYGLGWLKGKAQLLKDFGTAKWKKAGTRAVLKDMGVL